jgi:HK97 family phage prohead protease
VNNEIQYKAGNSAQIDIDHAQGIVECFVAGIGNKDSVGDVVLSGAFAKSLTRRKPRVVWGHNWNEPIGKVLDMYEVPPSDPRLPAKMKAAGIGGLYARVQFNLQSEKGKEAFANVAFFGAEQEWSIGYKTLDAVYDQAAKANLLKEVELYEVSPVLHGANQLTGTISVKSDQKNHMPGMMMRNNAVAVAIPVQNPRQERDAQETNLFAEGEARPLGDMSKAKLAMELSKRTGSRVEIIKATESNVIFERVTSDGVNSYFSVGYYTPDGGTTFMFSKPERVIEQTSYIPASSVNQEQTQISPMEQSYGTDSEDDNGFDNGQDAEIADNGEEEKAIWDNIVRGLFRRRRGFKSLEDIELEALGYILSDDIEQKAGRVLSSRNLSKLKNAIDTLQEVLSSAEKEMEVKTEEHIISVAIEDAFNVKQAIDPILDYYRVESYVADDGIVITSGLPDGFTDAIETAFKSLGGTIGGGGPGKARRAGRVLTGTFDPNAVDADGDKLVQEGTAFERPATPKVPDKLPKISSGAPGRPGQIKRDEKGQIDPTEAREMLKKIEEDRFARLRSLGFSEDEIQMLHGGPRGMNSRTVGSANRTGKGFTELKPDNWDKLDPYEKENALATDLHPDKSGMDAEVWIAQMKKVFEEQNKFELDKVKRERLAAVAAKPKAPKEAAQVVAQEPKKTAKKLNRAYPKNAEDAGKMRADDIETLQNALAYAEKLNERNKRGNYKQNAKTIDSVGKALEDDLTLDSLQEMKQSLDSHAASVDTRNQTPADKNVQKALDMINERIAAMDSFYSKDKFIDRGSRGELDAGDAGKLADMANPDSELENDLTGIAANLVRGESNARSAEPDGFDSSRAKVNSYLKASAKQQKARKTTRGFTSSRGNTDKAGRTQINAEATWFKQIEDSLPKEIREAEKAGDKTTAGSLQLLQKLMQRQESGKTGSRRTNAGVLLTSQDETDKILDAVMAVVDRQVKTGGSRAEIFSQLMDKMAQAAMSTFIDKTTPEINERK